MTNNVAQNYVYNQEEKQWDKKRDTFNMTHLSQTGISTSTNYILVDSDDTTNYPHANTGYLGLLHYNISLNPGTSWVGSIVIGFLDDVDASNGDFYPIVTYEMQKQSQIITQDVAYEYPIRLKPESVAVNPTTDDTGWQTDESLTSSTGSATPGTGDLVLKVNQSGGEINVSISCKYISCECE